MNTFSDQIKSQLAGATSGIHDLSFDIGGRTLHARLSLSANAKSLVTLFHGAVDFKSREIPVFIDGFVGLRRSAHQLSVSDPGVDPERNTNMAWYAGEDGFDSPGHIHDMIMAISAHLDVTRRVYFGTSAGGFAALALSHRDLGSFVVVGNPQTSISRYRLDHAIRRYREAAWPKMADNKDFEETTFGNMTRLYADGFENTIVYVQNIGDRHHFENHMMPFVGAIQNAENRDRLILNTEFLGGFGHVPTPREYLTWLTALCTAPSDSLEDILMTRHTIKQMADGAPTRPAAKQGASKATFSDQDISIAKLLAPKK